MRVLSTMWEVALVRSTLQKELLIYIATCLMSFNVTKRTVNQSYSSISSWVFLTGAFLGSLHHRSSWSLYIVTHLLYFCFQLCCCFFTISNTPSCFNLPLISTFLTLYPLCKPPSILLNALIYVASICLSCLACRVHASQPYVKVGTKKVKWRTMATSCARTKCSTRTTCQQSGNAWATELGANMYPDNLKEWFCYTLPT